MSFLGIREYTNIGPGGSDPIGGGGEATIYLIRHNSYGYIRALRVYKDPVIENSKWESFQKRCSQLMRLGNGNHPCIVHIYKLSRLEDRRPYIEVDYVKGETLRKYLQNNQGFLPVEEVLHMVERISSALSYCHFDTYKSSMNSDTDDDILKPDPVDGSKLQPLSKGDIEELVRRHRVIHNDIHSGNIMRRDNGEFVLIDFGLSVEGDEDIGSSSSRRRDGHPEFKAPERWDVENKELSKPTPQSDIYSFGVVMYEYLTGRVPFPSRTKDGWSPENDDIQLRDAHKHKEVPSINEARRLSFAMKYPGKQNEYKQDYPDWLEEAIKRCLEKDPEKRFRNGKELHEFITKHLQNEALTKESVQSLSDEIESLKDERQQALAQIADLTKKNSDLANLAAMTARDLERARIQLVGLQNHDDAGLKRELMALQEKIKQKDADITSLQSDVMKLERQLKESKNNSDLEVQIRFLQQQSDNLRQQVEQAQQEKKDLEAEIEKLKKGSGGKNKSLIVLCVLLGIVAAVLGFLYANKGGDDISGDYELIKAENVNLKTTIEEKENQINGLYDTITVLRNAKPDQSARERELEKLLTQADTTITGLENRINEQKAEINDLKNKKPDSSSKEKELEMELKKANSTIKTLQEKNAKLQRGLEEAIRQITQGK